MKNKILALVIILAGTGAAFAQSSAILNGAAAGLKSLGLPAATQALDADIPAAPAPEKATINIPTVVLPLDCQNMPMLYTVNGDLYANGVKVGDRVSQFKGACNGEVAWTDTYGNLYRNRTELGRSVQSFEIALYTGDVFWKDNYGTLRKNVDEIGRAQSYKVSDYTGIVAWTDNYGVLHKDAKELGRASAYQITGHTGDVVWTDNYSVLHKNTEALGRAGRFQVADRTGDVAWTDNYSVIYFNKAELGYRCQNFTLRADGRLVWWDSYGNSHYR